MNPAVWGLMAALTWGTADFIARFTGRALGTVAALVGMLAVGSLIGFAFLHIFDLSIPRDYDHAWLLGLAGVGIMGGTVLLYWGLARGPVTIVAPIVGAHPAINIVITLFWGARPSLLQWAAFAVVLLGGMVVARAAKTFEDGETFTAVHLRNTLFIALASAFVLAIGVAAAQAAIPYYGELQTVVVGRWISLFACLVLHTLLKGCAPRLPFKWWPLLLLQGCLDAGAYLALLFGSADLGAGAAITVVVASGFSAVTVILARLILKEAMTWGQWAGIALIVAGVATLSA